MDGNKLDGKEIIAFIVKIDEIQKESAKPKN
jgi:hypothetical protein